MKRYSIIQDEDHKFCILCGRRRDLHMHEVFFGTSNRKNSIKYGLCVYLCADDHIGKDGIHNNRVHDIWLKQLVQRTAMEHYGWEVEDFIKIFGKNYL